MASLGTSILLLSTVKFFMFKDVADGSWLFLLSLWVFFSQLKPVQQHSHIPNHTVYMPANSSFHIPVRMVAVSNWLLLKPAIAQCKLWPKLSAYWWWCSTSISHPLLNPIRTCSLAKKKNKKELKTLTTLVSSFDNVNDNQSLKNNYLLLLTTIARPQIHNKLCSDSRPPE